MGYTHYWKFRRGIGNGNYESCAPQDIINGKELFKESVELFKKCLAYMNGKTRMPNWGDDAYTKEVKMTLCGPMGKGEPKITDVVVAFNGCQAKNEDCESCYLELDYGGFQFCKTGRKPYDTAVWVCLLCFKYYFGENMEISSDGGEEEHRYAEEVFKAVVETL